MNSETEMALQQAKAEMATVAQKIETLAKKLAEEKGNEMVVIAHNGKLYKMTLAGAEIFAQEVQAFRTEPTEGTDASASQPGKKGIKRRIKGLFIKEE